MNQPGTSDTTSSVQGRLRSGPALELIRSANRLEVSNAPILYDGLSLADLAHVTLLMKAGIIPEVTGKQVLKAILEMRTLPCEAFPFDPARGDVYKNRESYLNQQLPEAGGWLRTGRARREATNIAYRIAVRRRVLTLLRALVDLGQAIVARAEEHTETLMADYTYLQQAQPTTLGHYLLGFLYPMLRDADRLQAFFGRINVSPGGISSVNGSRLSIDRQGLADLLGFDGAIHHTRDAMWQADTPIESTAAVVTLLINVSRLAEDLQVWTTKEFDLVELADQYARTSVIMPQKKNPYSLAYIRGLANVAIGDLVAMANVGRTSSGQPDSRIFAYGRVPGIFDRAAEALALMEGVVRTLKVNVPLMAERVALGYSQATDLAEVIMLSTGQPYQTAHRIVGHAIAKAIEREIPSEHMSADLFNEAAEVVLGHPLNLSSDILAEALDPRAIITTRTVLGGAAHAPMQKMIAECQGRLERIAQWCYDVEHRLDDAVAKLIALAQSLVDDNEDGGS
jgi:argininosuccinate lyase